MITDGNLTAEACTNCRWRLELELATDRSPRGRARLGLVRSVFFSADPDADLDGDGVVNPVDLGIMKELFFQPPGPAGSE